MAARVRMQWAVDQFVRLLQDQRHSRRNRTASQGGTPYRNRRNVTIEQRRRWRVRESEVRSVSDFVRRSTYEHRRLAVATGTMIIMLINMCSVVLEAELLFNDVISTKDTSFTFLRLVAISLTVSLLFGILLYHAYEVQLIKIDNGSVGWRVALSRSRLSQIAQELLICSICPLPGLGSLSWPYLGEPSRCPRSLNSSEINYSEPHEVPLDVLLVVPMFLRFYLIGRYMVVHSHSFQDAATRSIAALNRVSVDFKFVLKTHMREKPLHVIVYFTVCFWISVSWFFTQCERYAGAPEELTYLNSLWIIVISFLSIGYGDFVPHTYCGRIIAVGTGITGIGVAASVVAVVSRLLDLSKAEKQVNAFMADTKLCKQRDSAAATVLQETWRIYKYKYIELDPVRARTHQRRFLAAISEFRRIKWEKRKLLEHTNRLIDVGKVRSSVDQCCGSMHCKSDNKSDCSCEENAVSSCSYSGTDFISSGSRIIASTDGPLQRISIEE